MNLRNTAEWKKLVPEDYTLHDSIKGPNQAKQTCYVGVTKKKNKEMMNVNGYLWWGKRRVSHEGHVGGGQASKIMVMF